MSGSKQTTTSNEKRDPWAPSQPHLNNILQGAGQNYSNRLNQQYFPGQTYAGFSPESEYGLTAMKNRAMAGSPVTQNASTMVGDTLGGSYLSAGNPYFSAMADRVTGQTLPAITAQWQRAGRGTGNGAVIEAAGRGLGDAIGSLAYQNYGDERARQFQAAGMSPQIAAAEYGDAERMMGVGSMREGMTQRGIDEAMARYAFDQNRQADALKEYAGFTAPIAGLGGESNSTSTTSQKSSPLQTALGVGMMGASMFGGMGPFGAMGAFGGGLGGMSSASPFRMGFASPNVRW